MGRGHLPRLPAGPDRPRRRCENPVEDPEDRGGDVHIQGLGGPDIGGGEPRIDLDHDRTRGREDEIHLGIARKPRYCPGDRPGQGFEPRAEPRPGGAVVRQRNLMLRSIPAAFKEEQPLRDDGQSGSACAGGKARPLRAVPSRRDDAVPAATGRPETWRLGPMKGPKGLRLPAEDSHV